MNQKLNSFNWKFLRNTFPNVQISKWFYFPRCPSQNPPFNYLYPTSSVHCAVCSHETNFRKNPSFGKDKVLNSLKAEQVFTFRARLLVWIELKFWFFTDWNPLHPYPDLTSSKVLISSLQGDLRYFFVPSRVIQVWNE